MSAFYPDKSGFVRPCAEKGEGEAMNYFNQNTDEVLEALETTRDRKSVV